MLAERQTDRASGKNSIRCQSQTYIHVGRRAGTLTLKNNERHILTNKQTDSFYVRGELLFLCIYYTFFLPLFFLRLLHLFFNYIYF